MGISQRSIPLRGSAIEPDADQRRLDRLAEAGCGHRPVALRYEDIAAALAGFTFDPTQYPDFLTAERMHAGEPVLCPSTPLLPNPIIL